MGRLQKHNRLPYAKISLNRGSRSVFICGSKYLFEIFRWLLFPPGVARLFGLQEGDGIGGDAFFASGESEFLGSGRLYADLIGINLEGFGNVNDHRFYMRGEFGLLRYDGGVGIGEGYMGS